MKTHFQLNSCNFQVSSKNMLKRIPLNFSPVHPTEDFFPHAFCMQIVNRYKNNEKMFSEKTHRVEKKKFPTAKL